MAVYMKPYFRDIVGTLRNKLVNRMHLQDLNTMQDLRMKAIVRRGSFGIVKFVRYKADEKKVYALKCVSMKQVARQGQQNSIAIERYMQFIKTHITGYF